MGRHFLFMLLMPTGKAEDDLGGIAQYHLAPALLAAAQRAT
jgi:hypothetical protein